MATQSSSLEGHRVVSRQEWLAERTAFLQKEKEFTRLRDELNRQRRELPWEAVTKNYVFEGPDGKQALAELFNGRSQLIVYHFMFDPSWDAGCKHCSFWADNFNPNIVHINHRDASMIAVSRAPYSKVAAYQKRMGWTFRWMSSHDNDFNFDYNASFTPEEVAQKRGFYNFKMQDPGHSEHAGVSVFFKDRQEAIFRTYSTFARGIDLLNTAYNYIDLTPRGRYEDGHNQYWVRRHNEYDS